MKNAIHAARVVTIVAVVASTLALAATGCQSKSDDKDKKIAELQQQLDAAKAQGAPPADQKTQPAPAPAEGAAGAQAPAGQPPAADTGQSGAAPKSAGAPSKKPKAAAGVTADQYSKDKAKAADQYAKDKAKVKDFAEQQKSVNEQQAATNDKVEQQIADLKPHEVTLPVGTVIAARPSTDLSTENLKNGATFEALLEADLVADGVLVAKKGAHVTGVVASSDPGGRVKGVASLEVGVRAIEGLKGTTIRIHSDNFSTKADTSKGKDATRTGIMAGAGAVIGAIAGGGKGAAIGAGAGAATGVATNMATRGKAAVIPAETLIEFHLTAPVTVVVPK